MTADNLLLADAYLAGPLGRTALLVAQDELGVEEQPRGSNRGPRVEVYQLGSDKADYLVGQRWCARFARWCFETAAQRLGQPSPFAGWRSDLASALKWKTHATLRRCWTPDPAPGRVALHIGEGGHGHVAIVASIHDGMVTHIAGNEGDRVAGCHRRLPHLLRAHGV